MMSLVKPLNEKERINKTLKEVKKGDSVSMKQATRSQKEIIPVLQMQIDVNTYKALMRLAQSQKMSVEELVAGSIAALAGESPQGE